MLRCLLWVFLFSALLKIGTCALPEDISNYVNEYVCSTGVRLVRPLSIDDIKAAVTRHARVKAVGTGHSWNKIFCAPSPSTTQDPLDSSANIDMTTIRPLKIEVNEAEKYVWVSAGLMLGDLMDYLANYVTPAAPRGTSSSVFQLLEEICAGYALNAHPSNRNQTIGGTIATGSHGSSISYGTLSSHVIGVRAVVANGTCVTITEESHPFLMKAFRVNVGRLGVVTEVKIRIFEEILVRRTLWSAVPLDEVKLRLKEAQEMYRAVGDLPEWLDGTILLWMTENSTFEITNVDLFVNRESSECHHAWCYQPTTESISFLEALEAKVNTPVHLQRSEDGSDVANGVSWTVPTSFPPVVALTFPNATAIGEALRATSQRRFNGNATLETHKAIPTVPSSSFELIKMIPGDDYSLGIPVNKMADCLEGVAAMLDSTEGGTGLGAPIEIRFVGKEDALLSPSYKTPVMRMELGDFIYYHTPGRMSNKPLKKLMAFLVTSPLCSPARLHWGKAGWPDPGCWNGVESYEETWCEFGCAALELDPDGKFVGGDPDVWNWNGANLQKCCTPDGYDTSLEGCECEVIPVRTADECPEAPFYTNR